MDWLPAAWMYWLAIGGSPSPWDGAHNEAAPASCTAVDLWLVESTYRFIAAHAHCVRCGDPLGRGLRVVIRPDAEHAPCTGSIVTRCRGWRRHRHVATVVGVRNDLVLGPFRVTGRRPAHLTSPDGR
jgi:hypothetical protein